MEEGIIERVARAILAESQNMGALAYTTPIEYRLARAAIGAMREPTKEQVIAGNDKIDECVDFWSHESGGGYAIETFAANRCWEAMIDAALKQEEKE